MKDVQNIDFMGSPGSPFKIGSPFSDTLALMYRACAQNQASRNSPPDPGDPSEMGGATAVEPPIPHALGARMTVV